MTSVDGGRADAAAGFQLAIDFGTSSTVGVLRWPDGRITQLLFDGTPLLPSAVCSGPTGLLVGLDALHAARVRPEMLEPAPKQRVDDTNVLLGGSEVPVAQLIAAVLARVVVEAGRVAGRPVTEVTLTCPAAWGPRRREELLAAGARAGLAAVRLVAEPIAAAAYFDRLVPVPMGACAAVYDLGAGTFDASVVRRTPAGLEVLAADGLADAGGLDIDAAIVESLRVTYAHRDEQAWHRLTQPTTPAERQANRQLWDDVRRAKELLSRAPSTELHVPLLELDAPLGREQLEQLAEPIIARTVACTQVVLRRAGMAGQGTQLAGVFLVGGGSRLPLVATLLHRALGTAPTTIEQPELAVAEGSLFAPALAATPPAAVPAATPPAAVPAPAPGPVEPRAGGQAPSPVLPPAGGQTAPHGGRVPARRGRRRLVVLGIVAVLAAAAAAVAAVQLLPHGAAGGQPVCGRKLGFIGPITGTSAGFVESVYQAAELAVAQYDHAHPSCQVTLTRYDTKGVADSAKAFADTAVKDPAMIGLIGPAYSGEVLVAGPDLQAAGLPMITPSATDPGLSAHGWSVFHRLLGTDVDEARGAAATLTHDGATKVLVVDDGSSYPHLLASTVSTSLGAKLAGTATVTSTQTDFTAVVHEATHVKADAVYYPGFAASAGTLLRQLRDAHVTARFLGSASLIDDPQFAQAAGDAVTSATLTCGCRPAQGSSAATDFVKQFQQQYGTPAGPYSGFGYDAARIFLDGIAGGATSRSAMQAFVQSQSHKGIMGDYRFTANGELAADLVQVSLFTATAGTSKYTSPAR